MSKDSEFLLKRAEEKYGMTEIADLEKQLANARETVFKEVLLRDTVALYRQGEHSQAKLAHIIYEDRFSEASLSRAIKLYWGSPKALQAAAMKVVEDDVKISSEDYSKIISKLGEIDDSEAAKEIKNLLKNAYRNNKKDR